MPNIVRAWSLVSLALEFGFWIRYGSIYKNNPTTHPRIKSKPASSFETFHADAFPENGEGTACAVGLRLPVAQRLLFDCLAPRDGLAAEAEPVKP